MLNLTVACPSWVTSMLLTLPIGDAAGLDLVALDDLAGVDELGRDRVAAVAPEEQDCDCDDGEEDQGECEHPPS